MISKDDKYITSLQHPLVKHLVKLRQNKDYREEHQNVVICGNKIVYELSTNFPLLTLLKKTGFQPQSSLQANQTYEVSEELIKKISGLSQPEELIAVIKLPLSTPLKNRKKILTLDGISDPGNMGSLFRSALAFGWQGIFLLPHCVDPFNDKVIRASKGACFKIDFETGDIDLLKTRIKENNLITFIADLQGVPFKDVNEKEYFHLILGNESHGISKECLDLGKKITIPITNLMESLNVAVAGGILLQHFGL